MTGSGSVTRVIQPLLIGVPTVIGIAIALGKVLGNRELHAMSPFLGRTVGIEDRHRHQAVSDEQFLVLSAHRIGMAKLVSFCDELKRHEHLIRGGRVPRLAGMSA